MLFILIFAELNQCIGLIEINFFASNVNVELYKDDGFSLFQVRMLVDYNCEFTT